MSNALALSFTRTDEGRAARRQLRKRVTSAGLTTLTYVIALVVFFPLFWTVLTGFKTEAQAVAQPPVIFFHGTLSNYSEVLNGGYSGFFWNSVIISISATLLALLLGLPAAFSLAFYPTKNSPRVLSWVLSTRMLPVVGALIPLIIISKRAGLFDSRLGMILIYAAVNVPLVIWMMRSFFADMPRDILEASLVDGASFLQLMRRIILPLSLPGLASTALLALIFTWNEFLLAVNLTAVNASTLPVFISGFMTSEGLFWAKMSAASTLAIAPVIIAGWLAQRSLVRGLTFGAVK
ncbi:MAG: polyol transport system permease protein [Gaiellaceae bacterium]|jgi:sorbitol/mannitol transport system permease protein|nr:polyol transport system permease protein [Gaiellaceae bacterium]